MSFEPDTNDIRVRQLGEEIKKIREEQFAKAFPIGLGGGSSPVGGDAVTGGSSTGTFAWLPNMVRVTRDTGVVERLAYKDKNVNKDFFIGDIVDGVTSGASGEIGDIDITGTDTGFLIFVPGTTSGTFVDDEFLNATTDGNNVAKADLTLANPVGRGHLNAGSASIIAEATSSPAEIHFIDTAQQNGQLALMRAQNGQTIRIRRAVTNDGNTGNIDLDLSFDITENALVLFQFQAQSNVTPDGGWVPLITDVTTTGAGAGGGINFPILYPQTNLGSVGLQTVALDLNNPDGHYQVMTLTGDIAFAFVNETSVGVGFKFYTVLQQDAVGGHKLISVPSSVKNAGALLTQVDLAPLAQTLIQFTTADGGATYHSQIVDPTSSGQNQTPWLSPIDASTFDLFNIDKLIFFGAGGFSFPVDATLQAISTSGTGLQFNVGLDQTYRFFFGGVECIQLERNDFFFFDRNFRDVSSIFFTDSGSFTANINSVPSFAELQYITGGVGSHHSFFANNITGNASFEIREFVNKSNINFDMVTNNILNVDQILFHDLQGFNNATDHGERRLTGGDAGINMNLPVGSPFANAFTIWFEEDTLDRSNPYYQFTRQALIMGTGVGDCTRAPIVTGAIQYQLCRGGGLFDVGSRMILRTSADSGTFPMEQILELNVAGTTKVTMTNLSDGIQVFDDIGMNTFNIFDLDVLRYGVDSGVIGFGEYGSAVESDGSRLKWSVPPTRGYEWQIDLEKIVDLTAGVFRMNRNSQVTNPIIETDGSFILSDVHTQGTVGQIDGEHRLVDDLAGSFDVIFGTGGDLVNLSDLVGVGEGADKDLGNLDPLTKINSDLVPVSDGDLDLGLSDFSWNDLNIDRVIFRHNNGVVCDVPSIGRSSNALRLNSPLGNGITLEENCIPLYDFGVSPARGLTLQNGALFVRIQGVSTLHSITNLGSNMVFNNDANIFGRSFDFGDASNKGERINLYGSGESLTEFRFKTDVNIAIRDAGRIVFEAHNLSGSEIDYARLDGQTVITAVGSESGRSNWRVAELGNQNQAYISLDGSIQEIQMHRYTDFNQEVEFDNDVFHDGNRIFLDVDRDSFFRSNIDDVLFLNLNNNVEYIWTVDGYDILDKYMNLSQISEPGAGASNTTRIFLDSADNILKVKKFGGEVVSLESGGAGGSQTPWVSNIDGAGFSLIDASEIINLRRLFLFDDGSSGSGRIVFDTNGDQDTWIGTHSSTDSILIKINNGNAMRWNPVDGLRLGSTGAGNKFFLNVVKNYIRFDSEDPSQIPTPALTEVHMWFNQATDELSVKKDDGSIVSLEIGSGGNFWSDPVDSNIIPESDNDFDLGSNALRFKDGFFRGNMTVAGAGSFGTISTPAITGFASIGGNMTVAGDFSANGREILLGDSSADNLRIKAQIRTSLLFGATNEFATGPINGITKSGVINCEELVIVPAPTIPASQFGAPIIRGSITAGERIGYYTRPLALALGSPNGLAGTIQLPQREIGFSGGSASADVAFHGDGGCIGIENTNRFPNVTPKLIVRDNLGNWYECPLTLLHPAGS